MNHFTEKISLSLTRFEFARLDTRWNTRNFHLPQLGIPYARLYYPVEGEGYILFNGEKRILKPGRLYLIPPYAPVMVGCDARLVKYWGHFNAFILDSKLDIFSFSDSIIEIEDHSRELTTGLFQIACRHEAAHDGLAASARRSALFLLLEPFLRKLRETSLDGRKTARFAALLSYIETHLSEGLTLGKLADFSGLHPTYLSNLFAKEMGTPLMKYCNQRAICRALDLMWSGRYTFGEIAYKSGAENAAVFARLFRKYTGMTPREMKNSINSHLTGGGRAGPPEIPRRIN